MKHTAELDTHIATDRYASILQTAERLFGEKGYRGVSIEEIAKAAGVSKGLVLYHFTSKKALLEHVLKDGMNALLMRFDKSIRGGASARAKIRSLVEAHLDMISSRPYILRIGFFEGVFGEEMKNFMRNSTEEILRRMDMVVQEGVATGEFRSIDSRIAASLLLGITGGLAILTTLQQQPLMLGSQMADEITELFCNGLRP